MHRHITLFLPCTKQSHAMVNCFLAIRSSVIGSRFLLSSIDCRPSTILPASLPFFLILLTLACNTPSLPSTQQSDAIKARLPYGQRYSNNGLPSKITPIQLRYNQQEQVYLNNLLECNNEPCKTNLQIEHEQWSITYWEDTVKDIHNWVGQLTLLEKHNQSINFLILGLSGETFNGVLTTRDIFQREQIATIPINAMVSFSATQLLKPTRNYATLLIEPIFTIALDSIKVVELQ